MIFIGNVIEDVNFSFRWIDMKSRWCELVFGFVLKWIIVMDFYSFNSWHLNEIWVLFFELGHSRYTIKRLGASRIRVSRVFTIDVRESAKLYGVGFDFIGDKFSVYHNFYYFWKLLGALRIRFEENRSKYDWIKKNICENRRKLRNTTDLNNKICIRMILIYFGNEYKV